MATLPSSAASLRLAFLYPSFFCPRAARKHLPSRLTAAQPSLRGYHPPRRRIHGSARIYRPTPATTAATGVRYGTANEPPPHLTGESTAAQEATKDPDQGKQEPRTIPPSSKQVDQKQSSEKEEIQKNTGTEIPAAPDGSNKASQPDARTLTSLLNLNSALAQDGEEAPEEKPPQLRPPQYEHHFDTYSIMQNLRDGGLTAEQSVDIMKVTRGLLAANMELARDALLSKGEAEMQSYRFRARTAEMRTEIRSARSTSAEAQRSERNSLQHEVDILSQRINAETSALKDELKGMFDDRKMAVRKERQEVENRVQEVNYKITTEMSSEIKSEAEGLRWVLVRRAALTLVIVSLMILSTLRYAKHLDDAETLRKSKEAQAQMAGAEASSASKAYEGSERLYSESLG